MQVRASHQSAILLFSFVAFLSDAGLAGRLPVSSPESVGMRSERLNLIDEIVQEGIEQSKMPGCVVMIGRKGHVAFHEAYGHRQLEPTKVEMTRDTVFDMASITKPVATATSVMVLVEQGKIRLRDSVTTYIPEFGNSGKEYVTVTQLLTHQAGFVPDNALADYADGRRKAFENIYALKTMYDPGTRFVYSDVGFILLDDLIEKQSGTNVAAFSKKHIFEPLGMDETGYLPNDELKARTATTEQRESRWMQGEVHDPRAYAMDGVAGHAGLFSTAEDLAVYAQMMLNGGHYGGKRILAEQTVRLMTAPYEIVEGEKVSVRGLGWDKLSGYSSNRGENMSSDAFGHGGFTGTVLWIDPKNEMFFIFLSNRVHPNGKGIVNRLAGRIATVAVGAIDDDLLPASDNATLASSSPVQPGIDRLIDEEFRSLRGKRLGLITNQTGICSNGESTISVLHKSPNANLVALFSPEHGLEGKLDQSIIGDTVDGQSGVKVFSLYGNSRQPTPEQLDEVDTLVFDIQDIGCRFYTYISTMGLAMEAAEKAGKSFVVLDRPNPIGGIEVGGPLVDAGSESFVAFHSMPVRHGMTVGEIAQMFKAERGLSDLDLKIVRCHNWQRDQLFDETDLQWINPSPNMRNLNQAVLYPGIGLWETTNLSVGRGTDTPFEVVGAPWIDCRKLASHLNASGLQGVQFTARTFTPTSSKFASESCGGVQISITNRKLFNPITCGITFACTLRKLYPTDWQIDKANRIVVNESLLAAIKRGDSAESIVRSFQPGLHEFAQRRAAYLQY
ncbi:MAG: DUF1343 domain-containing protein [Planctomycetales bacterium]|nr:DUF1343 domain-containing protein [Planctomycetales bacterium]